MSMAIKVARSQNVGRAMPGTGMQGDPGLFGFLGKAVKGITGVVGGLGIPGISTAAGFVNRGISSLIKPKVRQRLSMAPLVQGPGITFPSRFATPQRPTPGFAGAVQRFLPGGQTGFQNGGPPGPGYKLNKSDYFLRDGTFVPAGSRWVKVRKRNPLNPRALSSAMSRMVSAKKASTMMGRITIRAKKCPA